MTHGACQSKVPDDYAEEYNTATDKGKEKSPKKAESDSNEDKEHLSYLVLL